MNVISIYRMWHRSLEFRGLIGAWAFFWVLFLMTPVSVRADVPIVKSQEKISDTDGNFSGVLTDMAFFGNAVAPLCDLDGDSVRELAVGTPGDDDGGNEAGAVWILFMASDGTVASEQKISSGNGGIPPGTFGAGDAFGTSVASLGDIDGNGTCDLLVGAQGDDDGGSNHGAAYVLFLTPTGFVMSFQKISDTQGGFTGDLDELDSFGNAVASIGDLDGDLMEDIVVTANGDDDGEVGPPGDTQPGAAWVLFIDSTGTVLDHQKISATAGGFTGTLGPQDQFGTSVAPLGDLDGNQVRDIALGAQGDSESGAPRGAIWILYLNTDGTIKGHQKINEVTGNFLGKLDNGDSFGRGIAAMGDLDGDGIAEIAVGAPQDDDGGVDRGAAWLLFLRQNGSVRFHLKISDTVGAFNAALQDGDLFATALAWLGDLDGDGIGDFAATAHHDDDGGVDRGSVYILSLRDAVPPAITTIVDVGNDQGRQVRLRFTQSLRDATDSPTPILQYEAYRRIDPLPLSRHRERLRNARERGMVSEASILLEGWDFAAAIPAHGECTYSAVVATLADSTVAAGQYWSAFFVRAATAVPTTFFDSVVDSGYSLDNLSPLTPSSFAVAYNVGSNLLSWGASQDPDFSEHRVYRSANAEFVPSLSTRVHTTTETEWLDPIGGGGQSHYKLTTVDHAGNESVPASPETVTRATDPVIPGRFVLHQNVPNPFNPVTTIRFEIARNGRVTLRVYDSTGRIVQTLVSSVLSPALHDARWDGRDVHGNLVASGVYFYRIDMDDFTQTKKMVLLK